MMSGRREVVDRVRAEPDYPAGNQNRTGITVPVNRNQIGFIEFRFISTGYEI
jgi:hypothetical protein